MKAVLCSEFAPRTQLALAEIAAPQPGPGQVAIRVEACGLNFFDGLMVEGKYQTKPDLPFVPGSELSGVVTGLGVGVSAFTIGQRVLAFAGIGGYGEVVAVDAGRVVAIPDALPFDAAAGFLITYATSHHALKDRANLQPGETLLVLGAAGGVGLAAVEIGKRMGATVIAAASNEGKLALCRQHGADHLINYADSDLKAALKEITGGRGVDVVYDPVGGAHSETAIRGLALNGRHLVIGFAAGEIPKIALNLLLLKQASLIGVFWGAFARANPAQHAANMAELFDWYAEGALRPHISARFDLSRYAEALDMVMERRATGKVVLCIGPKALQSLETQGHD